MARQTRRAAKPKTTTPPALPNENGSRRRRERIVGALLVAATFTVYSQALDHQFVSLDDWLYVTENPDVLKGLTADGAAWAFTTMHASNWHPLTWLSHMLDCELFGTSAGLHHLTNVILHCATLWLLLNVLCRMTGRFWPCAFVAVMFGLHPLHVESVAWVAERKDVLSAFLGVATLLAYVRYVRRPGGARYTLVGVLLALGLTAKPMLVTWPCLLLLLDYWPLRRFEQETPGRGSRARIALRLVAEKLPLMGLAAASSIVTIWAQHRGGAVVSSSLVPFTARVSNALVAYVGYLAKMFWPADLAVYYPHSYRAAPAWQVAGAALLLIVVTVLTIRARRSRPYLMVGWLWYVGTLVPVIGLVQVGSQAMADRYTYVPLIGILIMVAWGAGDLLGRTRLQKDLLWLAGVICVGLCAATTWVQISHWRNSVTLFEHALAVTEDNAPVHAFLAQALYNRGHAEEAIEHYEEALRIRPNEVSAMYNLGLVLYSEGRNAEAVERLSRVVTKQPNKAPARFFLGAALVREGRHGEAASHLRTALQLDPDAMRTHYELGAALAGTGEYAQAIEHYRHYLAFDSESAEAHFGLGDAFSALQRLDEAAEHYTAGLRLNPDDAAARAKLERIQARQDEGR